MASIFLIDVGATATMARYVMQLLEDGDLRSKMGEAAWHKRLKNHFLADANIRKLKEIYDHYSSRDNTFDGGNE